jgi:hypothetical protein
VERFCFALAIACVAIACNPKSLRPNYCHNNDDCTRPKVCTAMFMCEEPNDGSVDKSEAGDGADARDAGDAEVKFHCSVNTQCADGGVDGGPAVCEPDAGMCVECLKNDDCIAKPKTPICEAHMCRACKLDSECPDPKICMTDGHCAPSGEVIFVEVNSNCSGANGSSASPYCAPNDAVTMLGTGKDVILIRGPVNGPMLLNTSVVAPVVIGRQNSGGESGLVSTGNGVGVTVSSGDVLIRDLAVESSTSTTSKGIVASGTSTKLTLVNVTVNLTNGLGVQADTGAKLTMNRCTVQNNNRGGIQLGTLSFDITNTVIAKNGPGTDTGGVIWGGVRISATGQVPSSTRVLNNTVVQNNAAAFSCVTDVPIVGSIVFNNITGDGAGCTIASCCAVEPLLTAAYRLMSNSPCIGKLDPTMAALDDIDGQLRANGQMNDCGADEF